MAKLKRKEQADIRFKFIVNKLDDDAFRNQKFPSDTHTTKATFFYHCVQSILTAMK